MKTTPQHIQHLFLRGGFSALPATIAGYKDQANEEVVDDLFNS